MPCWITAAKLFIMVYLKLSIIIFLSGIFNISLSIGSLYQSSTPLPSLQDLFYTSPLFLSVTGKLLRSPLYSVKNHSNQVEALLTAATVSALLRLSMTTISLNSKDVFQVLLYLSKVSTWHYFRSTWHYCAPAFLKHFLSLPSVIPHASIFIFYVSAYFFARTSLCSIP